MNTKDIEYMGLAYQEALKAKEENEVPIGAIIVKDNIIISSGYNQREQMKSITKHAEIIAIEKASKKLNTWKLDECILYVTLEPCMMCSGAIIHSRIKQVIFGAYEKKEISLSKLLFQSSDKQILHHPSFTGGVLEEKCESLIKEYFKEKRK